MSIESVMPSSHLILCRPLLLLPSIFSNIRVFSNESVLRIRWSKPRWCSGKESVCECRRYRRPEFNPWVRRIPLSRKWQPTQVFLPGKFHGQRSVASYKELDRAKHIIFPFLMRLSDSASSSPHSSSLILPPFVSLMV